LTLIFGVAVVVVEVTPPVGGTLTVTPPVAASVVVGALMFTLSGAGAGAAVSVVVVVVVSSIAGWTGWVVLTVCSVLTRSTMEKPPLLNC
jgi:hypothetical protein